MNRRAAHPPLSKDGLAALGRALRAHWEDAGPASQERAALALGEAMSRERKVVDLFSRPPPSSAPARLAASVHGDEEVLLREVPGGGFLLCSEANLLWVEWRGRGAPTLRVSRGWKAERQVRRRGAPLRWVLRRTGQRAPGLPSVSAVVGGTRWTLFENR